jgi:hypothetical protein
LLPHQDQVLGWTEKSRLARPVEVESWRSAIAPNHQFGCWRRFLGNLQIDCNSVHRLHALRARPDGPNMRAYYGNPMTIR